MTQRLRGFLGRRVPVAALFALLLLAAFPPLDQGWLAVVAWAVLFASVRLARGVRAGRYLFGATFVFFLAGLWWTAPISVLGYVFTAFWCAAWEGLFGWALGAFLRRAPASRRALWLVLAPAAHLVADMLRTVVATGFPWFLTGYAGWRYAPLIGSADLMGVHGSTVALLLLATGLAECVVRVLEGRPQRYRPLVPGVALLALLTLWVAVKPAPTVTEGPVVIVLQANYPQETKEDLLASGHDKEMPTRAEWLRTHVDLIDQGRATAVTRELRPDLVIWPETMLPRVVDRPLDSADNAEQVWRPLAKWSRGAATLVGVLTFDPADGTTGNTMVLIGPDGEFLGSQDKQHLTPGGETLLFLDYLPEGAQRPVKDWLRDRFGYVPGLRAGAGPQALPVTLAEGRTARIGVSICYECLFPEISRGLTTAGADFLVNSSNFGWFAGTSEMRQAVALNSFRAAENRRAVVLASNNGVSTVIDPDGRPREEVGQDVRGVLVARVPLAAGTTLFTRCGEALAWLLGGLATFSGVLLARSGRPP